jgi:biopolymer transport protein ExbD
MPVKLSSYESEEHDEARIEIVPLIDIMFFLLASFMMVSLSMTQLQRVPMELPVASSGVSETQVPQLHLALSAEGVMKLEQKVITLTELAERLRAEPEPQELRVMLAADPQSRHQEVLRVLDVLRAAGVRRINFETQQPPKP